MDLKARLCAKGFTQIKGISFNETYAPVVRAASLRFQLADATRRRLKLDQVDFASAFLQCPIDGEVWLRCPGGVDVPPGHMLKLNKSIYGLKQSSHLWNLSLHRMLVDMEFRQAVGDPCLYVYDHNGVYVTISTWVDDCVVAYNDTDAWLKMYKAMGERYPMSRSGKLSFCLGMEVTQAEDCSWIELSQTKYIEDMASEFVQELGEYDWSHSKFETPGVHGQNFAREVLLNINPEANELTGACRFRELLGKMNYAMCWTRPDVATVLGLLARHQNCYYKMHWKALRHCAVYMIKSKNRCLRFSAPAGAEDDHLNLIGFVDSDFSGDVETSKSRTGYIYTCCAAHQLCGEVLLQSITAQSTSATQEKNPPMSHYVHFFLLLAICVPLHCGFRLH